MFSEWRVRYVLSSLLIDGEYAFVQLLLKLLHFLIEGAIQCLCLAHVFLSDWVSTMAMRDLLTSLYSSCRYCFLDLGGSWVASRREWLKRGVEVAFLSIMENYSILPMESYLPHALQISINLIMGNQRHYSVLII